MKRPIFVPVRVKTKRRVSTTHIKFVSPRYNPETEEESYFPPRKRGENKARKAEGETRGEAEGRPRRNK